jgi:hypothetical protein
VSGGERTFGSAVAEGELGEIVVFFSSLSGMDVVGDEGTLGSEIDEEKPKEIAEFFSNSSVSFSIWTVRAILCQSMLTLKASDRLASFCI